MRGFYARELSPGPGPGPTPGPSSSYFEVISGSAVKALKDIPTLILGSSKFENVSKDEVIFIYNNDSDHYISQNRGPFLIVAYDGSDLLQFDVVVRQCQELFYKGHFRYVDDDTESDLLYGYIYFDTNSLLENVGNVDLYNEILDSLHARMTKGLTIYATGDNQWDDVDRTPKNARLETYEIDYLRYWEDEYGHNYVFKSIYAHDDDITRVSNPNYFEFWNTSSSAGACRFEASGGVLELYTQIMDIYRWETEDVIKDALDDIYEIHKFNISTQEDEELDYNIVKYDSKHVETDIALESGNYYLLIDKESGRRVAQIRP